MSDTSSQINEPYASLVDLTSTLPTAPEIVRYAIDNGVEFFVDAFRAHARQRDTTDAGDIAVGLIIGNQDNVLRVLMGQYYHGDYRCIH